jgi:hypothetical protein
MAELQIRGLSKRVGDMRTFGLLAFAHAVAW